MDLTKLTPKKTIQTEMEESERRFRNAVRMQNEKARAVAELVRKHTKYPLSRTLKKPKLAPQSLQQLLDAC